MLLCQTNEFKEFKRDSMNWWKLEQLHDSSASSSWNKAIEYLVQKNNFPKKQINIGILDTDFDLNNQMLRKILWTNKNEIKEDSIDNDENNYRDDIFGWNFLGIKNKDSSLAYTLIEETRILRMCDSISFDSLKKRKKLPYYYKEVKSSYDSIISSLKSKINQYKEIETSYTYVMDTLSKLFTEKINIESLSNYKTSNDTIMGYVNFAKYYFENDFPYDEFMAYLKLKEMSLDICMNLEYDNHILIGNKSNSIKDIVYGNNIFGKNLSILEHGTSIAGIISQSLVDSTDSHPNNQQYNYPVKIMPVTFAGIGDFTDKDFYSAFKYTIDNGANIINISQSKAFSINPNILKKALVLSKKKNVLVVLSAGNQAMNLDKNWRFPQSIPRLFKKEFSNLLIVGASSKKLNQHIIDEDSNYGKSSIDIFAPGVDILTSNSNNSFEKKNGTSFAAPIVSNIAALIWSHYPNFKASDIKRIIMQSGYSFNGLVRVPYDGEKSADTKNDILKQSFKNLSKSGKVINAFNAIILAEKINSN